MRRDAPVRPSSNEVETTDMLAELNQTAAVYGVRPITVEELAYLITSDYGQEEDEDAATTQPYGT